MKAEADVKKILTVSSSLAREKDAEKLLDILIKASMEITNCDGAVLLIKDGGRWNVERLIIKFFGGQYEDCRGDDGGPLRGKATLFFSKNMFWLRIFGRHPVNIANVAGPALCGEVDYSGWKEFDRIIGSETISLLAIPMENDEEELIGGLFLLNAKDEKGRVIAFYEFFAQVLLSLTFQAGIRYSNLNDSVEIHDLFDSFVRVMSTGIDARTPYNANHTKNMVRYADRFIDWLNEREEDWHFTPSEKQQFRMCVWLHDIGKLTIPSEVMDKANRLGSKIEGIFSRFREIDLLDEIHYLRGRLANEERAYRKKTLGESLEVILTVNQIGYLPDGMLSRVQAIARMVYYNLAGEPHHWLTEDELEALSVRKGTLTKQEREIMESHVVMTTKMLGEIDFTPDYANVPLWASAHHEFLNGEGYPKGLTAEQIPKEVRLLTILDIFDALTARDRPYKMPTPCDNAFVILQNMADKGQIDGAILRLFQQSRAWLCQEKPISRGEPAPDNPA